MVPIFTEPLLQLYTVLVMEVIKHEVLIITVLLITIGLIYSSVAIGPVFAVYPDPCFGKQTNNCPNLHRTTDPENIVTTCCWSHFENTELYRQNCEINPFDGKLEIFGHVYDKKTKATFRP